MSLLNAEIICDLLYSSLSSDVDVNTTGYLQKTNWGLQEINNISKVTQIASNGKDENASILPSKMCSAIHNRNLKNYFPLYLAPSRHIIENVNWYISESENKLLARPKWNQEGPHED